MDEETSTISLKTESEADSTDAVTLETTENNSEKLLQNPKTDLHVADTKELDTEDTDMGSENQKAQDEDIETEQNKDFVKEDQELTPTIENQNDIKAIIVTDKSFTEIISDHEEDEIFFQPRANKLPSENVKNSDKDNEESSNENNEAIESVVIEKPEANNSNFPEETVEATDKLNDDNLLDSKNILNEALKIEKDTKKRASDNKLFLDRTRDHYGRFRKGSKVSKSKSFGDFSKLRSIGHFLRKSVSIASTMIGRASPMSLTDYSVCDTDDGHNSTASLCDRSDFKRIAKRKRRRRLGTYNVGLVPKRLLKKHKKPRPISVTSADSEAGMTSESSSVTSVPKRPRAKARLSSPRGSSEIRTRTSSRLALQQSPSHVPVLQAVISPPEDPLTSSRVAAPIVNVVFAMPQEGAAEPTSPSTPHIAQRYRFVPGAFSMTSLLPNKETSYSHPLQNVVQVLHANDVPMPTNVVTKTTVTKQQTPLPCVQKLYKLIYPNANQQQALMAANGYLTNPNAKMTSASVANDNSAFPSKTVKLEEGGTMPVGERHSLPGDYDIPLCSCRMGGSTFTNLYKVSFCQALDSIDGKSIGCRNPVDTNQKCRPAVRIPFMTLCDVHQTRLKNHQCCPGCGQFCTQGKFLKCKRDPSAPVHHFHRQCQIFQKSRHFCPHCGKQSDQYEVTLALNTDPRQIGVNVPPLETQRARMSQSRHLSIKTEDDSFHSKGPITTLKAGERTISTEGLPFGPHRSQLEDLLVMIDYHKPKKIRFTQKSLYNQASAGDLERVIHLIGEGFDVNYRYAEINNQTALHAAATNGHYLVCHVLIQSGAKPNEVDNDLGTPLMKAAEKNRLEIMKLLLIAGANIIAKGEDGMSPLHLAAREGHLESVAFLLETGKTNVNSTDEGGWTPLIWAAEHRRINIVKYLLEHGSDCNMKDNEENMALHWAAYSGSVDIAELFLDHYSDVDSCNEHGDRPLHIAARQDHYECVVLFLARGADCDARNNEGETPITCCRNQTSPVWMALRVNKQLRSYAARKQDRVPRLVHRDISFGKERNPIAVVNAVDDARWPDDFLYVMENIETSPLNVNRIITSLQSCTCLDECGSNMCICSRNSLRCWYDKEGRLNEDFNRFEPPLLFECNRRCQCWSTCNNRVVQHGITTRLQLFRTEGRGWGVKTLLDIPQGTFICEYIGEMISDFEADRREDDSYLFDLDNKEGDTYCIDARKYGNIARFINHLCEPNIIPVKLFVDHQDLRFPRICFFSSRLIKAGEELGFDYSEKFWIIKWKQFTCECGSPRCRYSKEVIHKTLAEYHARMEEDYVPMDTAAK